MSRYDFIFSDERKYWIRRHATFWIAWWLFQSFLYSFVAINSATAFALRLPTSMAESLIFLTVHMFLSYTLIYFVIPRYLLRQRYILSALLIVASFLVAACLSATLALLVIEPIRECILGHEYVGPERTASVVIFLSLMAGLRGAITIGGLAAAIKLMKTLYKKEQRNLQLQKENISSQLQLLKAQVHPHFLFNTLNNIYAHSQGTSPTAARLVSGLSDLLRFMLYESNQPLVPLSKELKMLHDYISLENIRYGNKLELHLDFPADTRHLYIAPLMLLPLVENAFKHGTSDVLDQPWITMSVKLENNTLHMKLLNGKSADTQEATGSSGIGIQNVRQRLQLLYPDRHTFIITNEAEVFIVNLRIELDAIQTFTRSQPAIPSTTHA